MSLSETCSLVDCIPILEAVQSCLKILIKSCEMELASETAQVNSLHASMVLYMVCIERFESVQLHRCELMIVYVKQFEHHPCSS